jgi:hypothetical protein
VQAQAGLQLLWALHKFSGEYGVASVGHYTIAGWCCSAPAGSGGAMVCCVLVEAALILCRLCLLLFGAGCCAALGVYTWGFWQ